MKLSHRLLCLLLFPLALVAQDRGGANIAAFSGTPVDVVLHVEANGGDDANAGTPEAPFRTLGAALDRAEFLINAEEKHVKVLVGPGIYREQIRKFFVGRRATGLKKMKEFEPQRDALEKTVYRLMRTHLSEGLDRDTNKMLIIEATEPGKAIFDGAEPFTAWDETAPGLFQHAWPHRWERYNDEVQNGPLEEMGRWREMVFVNGERLLHVAKPEALNAVSTGFAIDRDKGLLVVKFPDLKAQDVQVSTWPRETADWGGRFLNFEHSANIALRGLVFRRLATLCTERAVNFYGCENILIEDVEVSDCNWYGFEATNTNHLTVRNSRFNRNGCNGINGVYIWNARFENIQTNDNGWRSGGLGKWLDWLNAGMKLAIVHNLSIVGHESVRNLGCGLWLDSDLKDIVVTRADYSHNTSPDKRRSGYGVFVEHALGPILFEDCRINDNHVGFYNSATSNVTLRQVEMLRNRNAAIGVVKHDRNLLGDFRNPQFKPLSWEKVPAANMRVERCVLSTPGKISQMYFNWSDVQGYGEYLNTLRFRDNVYRSTDAEPFQILDKGTLKFVDFRAWQKAVDDKGSRFERGE